MHLKYETVRRLVTVGASADPAKALEDMRAGVKTRVKAHRDRKAAGVLRKTQSGPKMRRTSN